jgi:hypothetical protein
MRSGSDSDGGGGSGGGGGGGGAGAWLVSLSAIEDLLEFVDENTARDACHAGQEEGQGDEQEPCLPPDELGYGLHDVDLSVEQGEPGEARVAPEVTVSEIADLQGRKRSRGEGQHCEERGQGCEKQPGGADPGGAAEATERHDDASEAEEYAGLAIQGFGVRSLPVTLRLHPRRDQVERR